MSEELAVAQLPVDSLQSAMLPRSTGIDDDYAWLLGNSLHLLPPVLVQRSTMKLIDGSHRVRAHVLRDRTHIAGLLVNADDTQALRHAVEANRRHGRPLSLADRRCAARRMIALNPDWSDRYLATACGLSGKTVAAIRRTCGVAQPPFRVGMDGRVRPIDRDAGRRVARSVLENAPDAPLRAVAAKAGISPTTVHAVRERMRGSSASG